MHDLLYGAILRYCSHPKELPDVLCVADTGTYVANKATYIGPKANPDGKAMFEAIDKYGGVTAGFTSYVDSYEQNDKLNDSRGRILGSFIWRTMERMAYEDSSLRIFTDYLGKSWEYG